MSRLASLQVRTCKDRGFTPRNSHIKYMRPKILDNVDKVVVELRLVPYLLMVTVNFILDMRFKPLKLLRQRTFVET